MPRDKKTETKPVSGNIWEDYNKALETYLAPKMTDVTKNAETTEDDKSTNIDKLSGVNTERHSQIKIIGNVKQSIQEQGLGRNVKGHNKLLACFAVLQNSIVEAHIVGHSRFKAQLASLVDKYMPTHSVEKLGIIQDFKDWLVNKPELPTTWFKGLDSQLQATFIASLKNLYESAAKEDAEFTQAVLMETVPVKASRYTAWFGSTNKEEPSVAEATEESEQAPTF